MIEWYKYDDKWPEVKEAARNTIGRSGPGKYPDYWWKKRLLLAEHSPIRRIKASWRWVDLKYWVSVHFVRHKFGIEHWVSTQRTDRTGVDREVKTQNSPVCHECEANAQALINISRKRLCMQAAAETRQAWQEVVDAVSAKDTALGDVLVPECIYRGFCPELKSCGYAESENYRKRLKKYREKYPTI